MTPAERERALAYLAETRESLVRSTGHLSRAQLEFKPAPDRWSVGECLEHIVMVEDFILGSIHDALRQPAGSFGPTMGDEEFQALMKQAGTRANRVKAPENLVPTGRRPHDQLLPEFHAARKRTADFVGSTKAQLRQHGFPHPMGFPFDCYQWVLAIAAHGDRHRKQAEEVMAEANFPRAAAAR